MLPSVVYLWIIQECVSSLFRTVVFLLLGDELLTTPPLSTCTLFTENSQEEFN